MRTASIPAASDRPQGAPPSPEDSAANADGDGRLTESEIIADGEMRTQEIGERTRFPQPDLKEGTDVDLSRLLESRARGISAYQASGLWSGLFESNTSLNLAD